MGRPFSILNRIIYYFYTFKSCFKHCLSSKNKYEWFFLKCWIYHDVNLDKRCKEQCNIPLKSTYEYICQIVMYVLVTVLHEIIHMLRYGHIIRQTLKYKHYISLATGAYILLLKLSPGHVYKS